MVAGAALSCIYYVTLTQILSVTISPKDGVPCLHCRGEHLGPRARKRAEGVREGEGGLAGTPHTSSPHASAASPQAASWSAASAFSAWPPAASELCGWASPQSEGRGSLFSGKGRKGCEIGDLHFHECQEPREPPGPQPSAG